MNEIGLADTFDLSESEDSYDDDPSPPAPPPRPSPRHQYAASALDELPTDSESESGSDAPPVPPPPPPPPPSLLVPGPPPGSPPSSRKVGSRSSTKMSVSFARDKNKPIPPPPPPPKSPSSPLKTVDKDENIGVAGIDSLQSPVNRSHKYILAGAVLASVLVIGLAAGLSMRSNSSGNGDLTPTYAPTSFPSYQGQLQAKTGFEFIDEYEGPEKLPTQAEATDLEHIDEYPGPGPHDYQNSDETQVLEDVDLGEQQWVDILHEQNEEEAENETEEEDEGNSQDVIGDDRPPPALAPPTKLPIPNEIPTTETPTPFPTLTPSTAVPTSYLWYTLPEPKDPDDTYFNYSPKSLSVYGPDSWGSLSDTEEEEYWSEYDEWIDPSLRRNYCDSGSNRQSPIDLSFDIVNGECFEYHQIKDRAGTVTMDDENNVRFEIHPSKLRINYAWESTPMRNFDAEAGFIVPSADIPKGWGTYLPVLHIDLKIPSEHTIAGKRYAAEYQIFLIQNKDSTRGAPAVSVLFDFHPDDRRNQALQDVLDKFQLIWDADANECNERKKKNRNLTEEEIAEVRNTGISSSFNRRELQGGVFNPWHHEIIRSAWFYGYEGSLTEPPCSEFVEWRIIDSPARISRDQLEQMQNLLFGHVDGNCRMTSVHHNGSVARPIQPSLGRTVHKCMCRDFLGNGHRKWYGRNRCWEGDEHVFHEKDTEGNWITSPETRPDRTAGGVWNCWHDDELVPPCCGRTYDPFHECCAEGTC
mmetsp:Transcript_17012/g.33979  ORF Transcript_17012/g.33979 Transcript_17012/m.33979 type:complete len:752 (+) Transcript_17012:277-2532(+)